MVGYKGSSQELAKPDIFAARDGGMIAELFKRKRPMDEDEVRDVKINGVWTSTKNNCYMHGCRIYKAANTPFRRC